MTPLIERYLQNVRISLPAARRDDIVRELAEDIRTQIADREEELGRTLSEDEQEALLKHFGHPLALATRYGPQRHVIGPALFPVYWMTLKIALGGALAVNVAIAIAWLATGSPAGRALGHLASFPFTIGVTVFGWITLVFALLDLNLPRLLEHAWADLKVVTLPRPEGKGRRWTLLAEIVGGTVFLIWWLAIPRSPVLLFGPAAAFLAPAPIFDQLYVPIAAIWLASLVVLWAVLLRPDWARVRTIGRFLTDTLSLVLAIDPAAHRRGRATRARRRGDRQDRRRRPLHQRAGTDRRADLAARGDLADLPLDVSDRHGVQHRPLTAPAYVTT